MVYQQFGHIDTVRDQSLIKLCVSCHMPGAFVKRLLVLAPPAHNVQQASGMLPLATHPACVSKAIRADKGYTLASWLVAADVWLFQSRIMCAAAVTGQAACVKPDAVP
jgi:hypothetical protein